jgi:hypothetical protein
MKTMQNTEDPVIVGNNNYLIIFYDVENEKVLHPTGYVAKSFRYRNL